MARRNGRMPMVLRAGHAGLTGTLCAMMIAPPVLAEEAVGGVGMPTQNHAAALTRQEKVLHALNRFTFGARPGDEAAVEKIGLEKWFQLQLHPERIDDAAFELAMQRFPAMQLTNAELMRRFPSPQMIRQMSMKAAALPKEPVERAVYADAEAVYAAKMKKDAADNAAADAAAKSGAPGSVVSGTLMSDGTVVGIEGGPGESGRLLPQTITHPATQSARVEDGALVSVTDVEDGALNRGEDGALGTSGVEGVLALGPEERMARLVAMSPEEMMAFRAAIRPRDRPMLVEGLTPQQVEMVEAMQGGPVRVVGAEALETRLMRDVDSQRQLQAVMTDFWLNHFNVYVRKNQQEPYLLPEYQRDVILPHALGKFEDLLVATAKSPAMLMYLDNWESVGPDSPAAMRVAGVKMAQRLALNGQLAQKLPRGINENYGRELMELHTLGVGGGYTQKDVIEVAKCFTGWTIDRPYGGSGGLRKTEDGPPGEFVFEANRHEPGAKVVLGHTIAEGGMKEGLEVLHILATSPATAHFISKEMAVRFVSDNPPAALVDRMAGTFLKSDGDIAAVLTTMFHAKEFWAPQVYRAKVKTPLEFMTSALRASDATVKNPLPLVQAMDRLGMPIYGMQTPNGYAWTAEDWVSSNALISRMNFALVLSGDRVAGTTTNWPALLGGEGVASAATEKELEGVLLGAPAGVRTREAVMAEFGNPTAQEAAEVSLNAQAAGLTRMKAVRGGQTETPLDTMAGLLLGSPEFQRR